MTAYMIIPFLGWSGYMMTLTWNDEEEQFSAGSMFVLFMWCVVDLIKLIG